jgi:hypothetical protein
VLLIHCLTCRSLLVHNAQESSLSSSGFLKGSNARRLQFEGFFDIANGGGVNPFGTGPLGVGLIALPSATGGITPATTTGSTVNNVEFAGGIAGGAALGQGSTAFNFDNLASFRGENSGSTTSSGFTVAYVGLPPDTPFFNSAFIPNDNQANFPLNSAP